MSLIGVVPYRGDRRGVLASPSAAKAEMGSLPHPDLWLIGGDDGQPVRLCPTLCPRAAIIDPKPPPASQPDK
jgi:hypothetical protein